MKIDAHQHFWDPARGDYGWLTPDLHALYRCFGPEDLWPLMEVAGIEASILVQAAPSEAETDYLLELAEATPWVRGVVGWIDLDRSDVTRHIAERAPSLVGIRPMLQDLPDLDWIIAESRWPALHALASHHLVFDALIRPSQLRAIIEIARRHPDLRIVIDHAAKPVIDGEPDPAWVRDLRSAGDLPNVACKISGLLTEAPPAAADEILDPYLRVLLDAFGVDRLMFGSDWPVLTQAAPYGRWIRTMNEWLAPLGPVAEAAVMGLNAQRIYFGRGHP